MAEPLFDQLRQLQRAFPGHPPVQQWDPPLSGDMDLRIARDGRWIHEGEVIQRQSLVRLFAGILKREGDEYFLITPVEKWRIQVEDVPFIATQVAIGRERNRELLLFTTDTGDVVPLDHHHSFELKPFGEPPQSLPYIEVRDGLQARLSRDVYYQLVDWAENVSTGRNNSGQLWIRSAGERFLLGEY